MTKEFLYKEFILVRKLTELQMRFLFGVFPLVVSSLRYIQNDNPLALD